ncbi:hypothetical protein Bca52824_091379 [Brassica carinata]|uniref:ArsA/GET3 Anion-transporting ATPase-like domain-containing protein n=1 Tax=Brassica carinata TaxID=52824 RepID=A0A8X7NWU4_BRACI|nr:hypothetical protein Bca52824_091379 [Brassica carinata]
MDPPPRNLPPSRRKIDVDKNSSNQTEVLQFMESPEYNRFTHIVLDTTPTEHTLRLLSLSDFYDSSIGKIKLKKKITAAASAFMSVFGKKEIQQQRPSNELDQLKERMEKVLNVFSEVDTTEKENVPVHKFIVKQLLPHFEFDCKFCSVERKEQTRVLRLIQDDTKHLTRDILNSCCYKKQLHGWYELYSDN